jgi:hypothetical protein
LKTESLQKHLAKFKGWRESLFLVMLAERSFPNYALFSDLVELSTAEKMADIINQCWEIIEENDRNKDRTDKLLLTLDEITPDPEKYEVYGLNPALDCCELVQMVLFSWVNPENRRAHTAAMKSLNSVLEFIEYREGEGLDDDAMVELFDNHPLLIEENAFQEEAFKMIKAERFPSASFIRKLKVLAENDGVSNLGISLE